MLWWLYDTYKIVVGTRTIRRVFERKGTSFKSKARRSVSTDIGQVDGGDADDSDLITPGGPYQTPYAPMAVPNGGDQTEMQLAQALQQTQQETPQPNFQLPMDLEGDLPEDEETIQLQLQQIALQKREVELKLRMRRMQHGRDPRTPGSSKKSTPMSAPSTLYKGPHQQRPPSPPKRDSRSKRKQEESKRKTAERQERMLRDLERRSRRREHLTAEWVQSKDIWPLRAQSLLADLMHRYACYAFSQQNVDTFEAMYRELYQLVDLSKGDWNMQVHDEMLRERMKRKMGQLRTKMIKTGEIIGRTDGYGGYQKAEDYTGEEAGTALADETELAQAAEGNVFAQAETGAGLHGHHPTDPQIQAHDPQLQYDMTHADATAPTAPMQHDHLQHDQLGHDQLQHDQLQHDQLQHDQLQHDQMQHDQLQHDQLQHDQLQHDQLQHAHAGMPYGSAMLQHQAPGQYPMLPPEHHMAALPYGPQMSGHQGLTEDSMSVM
ncbi:hypothetical protein K431DRAFT_255467 [Polychaeton citri CBS 116435]|uniref:Uncharacterized protein n=1 Tax=Polychaeton citri CBS 116435 TaxID=1314669 RepID=A0A9P4Q0T7_9PEZI|nr:hypothetical protein K431DRAFT_255467 [Polychaeton citri CBS 116435]